MLINDKRPPAGGLLLLLYEKSAIGLLPLAWEQEKGTDICVSTPFAHVSI